MPYTPKTWTTGETITAAELNAIEQAASTIAAAADTANAGLGGKVDSGTYTAGLAAKADLASGVVPDAQLPSRLSDASLKAAYASTLTAHKVIRVPASGDQTGAADTLALQAALDSSTDKHIALDDAAYYTTGLTGTHVGRVIEGSSPENGTKLYLVGGGQLYTNGSDNGLAWDGNYYDGPESLTFRNISLFTLNPTTALDNGLGSYTPGTYGIRDWRGGSIYLENVEIAGFDFPFWGVQSDLNSWQNVVFKWNHSGVYLGPRSDQLDARGCYWIYNDRALDIDSAFQARLRGCVFADNGATTTNPVRVRSQYSRSAQGTDFDACWFEHLRGPAVVEAFVEIGVGDTNQTTGVHFRSATITTNDSAGANHMKYLIKSGNAQAITVDEIDNTGAYGLDALVNCVGSTSPSITLKLAAIFGNHAHLQVLNSGTGSPIVTKMIHGGGTLGNGQFDLTVDIKGATILGRSTVTAGTDTSTAPAMRVNGAAGNTRPVSWQTASSDRWFLRATGDAETGSNAGTNLELVARSDAGANLGTLLTFIRSTQGFRHENKPLGFYGTNPIGKQVGTPAAATDLASAVTLVNDLRTKLIALGLIG